MKSTRKGPTTVPRARPQRTSTSYPSARSEASADPDSGDFPSVPWNDPAWFDPDRWDLGPGIPGDDTVSLRRSVRGRRPSRSGGLP